MPRQRYRNQKEPQETSYDTTLPTDQPVAVYYRQSTAHQVGNISTEIQTVDMVEYMKRMGWLEENIILVDMDAGISGSTKIDERKGMSELYRLITSNSIGAVSCQDEDRLFRDVTQIQVNIFIEACKIHKVLVVTPSMVYNFSHPQMGTFHARQFRFKSEMAAEYIETFVRGRLHRAIERVALSGRWSGSQMAAGYMVDDRKLLPNGAANPDYRKFVVFEPYAKVVKEYWRLFLQYGGQIRPTITHIDEYGPYYPDPAICSAPEGFRVVYRLGQRNGKYYQTTRTGLRQMLTNGTYLGHWIVKGRVVIWDNHSAIIDDETFRRAFDYLSDVWLDGSPNRNYSPVKTHAKASKISERSEAWPLCAGMIFTKCEGKDVRLAVRWYRKSQQHSYYCISPITDKTVWNKKASNVDEAIAIEMLRNLEATFDFDKWECAVADVAKQYEAENSLRKDQLIQLQTVMENLLNSLATLQHPQMIKAAEKRYADAEHEMSRLQKEIAIQREGTVSVAQIRQLRDSYSDIAIHWPDMEYDRKRELLHTFIEKIMAEHLGKDGLLLTIHWKDGTQSDVTVHVQRGPRTLWSQEQTDRLIKMYEAGVEQLEIAKKFPNRKWMSLTYRYRLCVKPENRVKYTGKRGMKKTECYNDVAERLGEKKRLTSCETESHPLGDRHSGFPSIQPYVC